MCIRDRRGGHGRVRTAGRRPAGGGAAVCAAAAMEPGERLVVEAARARKLAGRLREIVASTLELQVKDPRLGMVTITDARVSPDLREATVYYTVYGDDAERAASAAALESARGVVRSQVGRQAGVKFTPSLAFIADVVPDSARRIAELVARARARATSSAIR